MAKVAECECGSSYPCTRALLATSTREVDSEIFLSEGATKRSRRVLGRKIDMEYEHLDLLERKEKRKKPP